MVAHCLFEQSGTFKNEFKKLGIEAYDYDILNEFGQTDYQIDLFAEIEKGKNATGLNTYNPENDFVITRDTYLEKLKSMSNKVAVDAPTATQP